MSKNRLVLNSILVGSFEQEKLQLFNYLCSSLLGTKCMHLPVALMRWLNLLSCSAIEQNLRKNCLKSAFKWTKNGAEIHKNEPKCTQFLNFQGRKTCHSYVDFARCTKGIYVDVT